MDPLLGGVGVGSCTGHRAQGTEHRGKNGMRLAACGKRRINRHFCLVRNVNEPCVECK